MRSPLESESEFLFLANTYAILFAASLGSIHTTTATIPFSRYQKIPGGGLSTRAVLSIGAAVEQILLASAGSIRVANSDTPSARKNRVSGSRSHPRAATRRRPAIRATSGDANPHREMARAKLTPFSSCKVG